jgi:cell wall-associated NlpC family hydrolase
VQGASAAAQARAAAQAVADAQAAAQDAIDRAQGAVPTPSTRVSSPSTSSPGPRTNAAGQQVSSAVSWALDQQGLPYVWGGGHGPGVGADTGSGLAVDAGARGFDCSGLIHDAYQKVGVSVPATAEAWSSWPHRVSSVGALQPGDVIQCNGGGHVVLYIGGGQVVAASGGPSGGGNDKVLIQGVPSGITGMFRPIPGALVDASVIDSTVADVDPGDVALPKRDQKAVRQSVNAFRGLVDRADQNGLLGAPIKKRISEAFQAIGALMRDGITGNEADKIKALLDPLDDELDKRLERQKDRIKAALEAWQDIIEDKRAGVARAFGDVLDGVSKVWDAKTDRILRDFDTVTRQMVETARATVTVGGIGTARTFEIGEGEETPAERELRLRREAKATEDAADAIARARERLEEARRGRRVMVKGVSIDVSTGKVSEVESEQMIADAQEIADAQKALDDLLYDQETEAIERRARQEREAADKALEARREQIEREREQERQAIEDERELARSRMEARVNGIIDAVKSGAITAAQGQQQLLDTLTAFDSDWANAGGLLGSSFAEAFSAAIRSITDIIRDATNVEANKPPGAPPTKPPADKDEPAKPKKRTSFRWYGETWTKDELDAFKEALADHGVSYEQWKKNNPEIAVVFAARGAVVNRPIIAGGDPAARRPARAGDAPPGVRRQRRRRAPDDQRERLWHDDVRGRAGPHPDRHRGPAAGGQLPQPELARPAPAAGADTRSWRTTSRSIRATSGRRSRSRPTRSPGSTTSSSSSSLAPRTRSSGSRGRARSGSRSTSPAPPPLTGRPTRSRPRSRTTRSWRAAPP